MRSDTSSVPDLKIKLDTLKHKTQKVTRITV